MMTFVKIENACIIQLPRPDIRKVGSRAMTTPDPSLLKTYLTSSYSHNIDDLK